MTTVKADVDLEKALAWIDEHWTGQKACPICTNTCWGIADTVGEIPMMELNGDLTGGVCPLVILTCQTCGYTLLLNAKVIGLVKGKE